MLHSLQMRSTGFFAHVYYQRINYKYTSDYYHGDLCIILIEL